MGDRSPIEWTDATWNPVTGCTKVSQGCKHCYAERMAQRLQAMGAARYANGFRVTLHPDVLTKPLAWTKPRRIFVNSMSDLFHPDVPDAFITQVFHMMQQTPRHTYQILTKRPQRVADMADHLPFPPNVWMGTSVESSAVLERVAWLHEIPAAVRFLSCEPLLGPLSALPLDGIHWVLSEANRVPTPGRWSPHGSSPFAINVRRTRCRFSLSSGAVSTAHNPGGF